MDTAQGPNTSKGFLSPMRVRRQAEERKENRRRLVNISLAPLSWNNVLAEKSDGQCERKGKSEIDRQTGIEIDRETERYKSGRGSERWRQG